MMRDAAQAYIQASIVGLGKPTTWVRLPRSMWPPEWFTKDGKPVYADTVVPLLKALYGHPESGALWRSTWPPSSPRWDGRNATRTRASGFIHQVRCWPSMSTTP